MAVEVFLARRLEVGFVLVYVQMNISKLQWDPRSL